MLMRLYLAAMTTDYGYAQPIVLEILNVVITQPVQPVESVLILSTITIVSNMTSSATVPSITTTLGYPGTAPALYNGTFSSNNITLYNITTNGTLTNGTINNSTSRRSSGSSLLYPQALNYSNPQGREPNEFHF